MTGTLGGVIAASTQAAALLLSNSSSTINASQFQAKGLAGSASTIANITTNSTLSFVGGILVSVTQ